MTQGFLLILQVIFWLGATALISHFVIFPLTMLLIGSRPKVVHFELSENKSKWPKVTVIIAALNEEKHIVERLHNLLGQNYPTEKLQVLVGSDGSSDHTVALAKSIHAEGIEVFDFPNRRGKASVLNDLTQQARGDFLVFTDANTLFHLDAIYHLMVASSPPGVGAVCGELTIVDPQKGSNVDSKFWAIEQKIKLGASALNCLIGANGAIYAIRRELFESLEPTTIVDDLTVVARIGLNGHRVIYEPQACAFEESHPSMLSEFRRRRRIAEGCYVFLETHLRRIFQAPGRWLGVFFVHKIIRWYTPHIWLLMLGCLLFLQSIKIYFLVLLFAVSWHTAGALIILVANHIRLPSSIRLIGFFNLMLLAILIGWWNFKSTNSSGTWDRTER